MNTANWAINFPPEVMTEYTGEKLGRYHTADDVMYRVQVESWNMFEELYGIKNLQTVYASGGLSYIAASVMGAEIEFPEDDAPQVRNRRFSSIDKACETEIPLIENTGIMPIVLNNYKKFKEKSMGKGIKVLSGIGAQGPFTTAVILRGMDMFTDLVIEPEKSKQFLDICADVNIKLVKIAEDLHGEKYSTLGIGDDYGGMVSPEMYEEFILPYLKKVYDAFPGKNRFFHCETLGINHLKYLKEIKIDMYDPGVDDRLTVTDLLKNTDVRFSYNLFTVRDMLRGTPDIIRKKYLDAVSQGAPEITTELCRGTPKENIKAFIEVARECE